MGEKLDKAIEIAEKVLEEIGKQIDEKSKKDS